ncbi:hypothetical protein LXM94_03275 [Rhizobium sp. TRM95111]|uniref:hypothetical protein n=1 Tax=Rhizobium alarense TaxID=2846851 RepID=UPI001F3815B2|nr:hypothetical protein [Rhizobium alarense]MCF3638985.1 hypothetical protein [Rhizobium alarense]
MRVFTKCLLGMLLVAVPGERASAQNIITDAVAQEKRAVAAQCKTAEFGEDFARDIDFNNDGLPDVVTNLGAVRCDGKDGGLCGNVGCPYNFYIQVAEGGYFFAANADLYGYELQKRYGNMVLALKANAASCGRDDESYCTITIRVRGATFETISKK